MGNESNSPQYDFSDVVANIGKVREMKAKQKKRVPTSLRPLKFDPNPDDSPLKAALVKRINERNLTYGDLYKYCTEIKNGNPTEGQKFGYNLISCLRNRHTMMDSTFSILCDFLNLDVALIDRKVIENPDNITPEEEERAKMLEIEPKEEPK